MGKLELIRAIRPVALTGLEGLLFRFGFICHGAADPPEGDAVWARVVQSWQRLEADGLVIHHHPEARVRHHRGEAGSAVLIGHAFVTRGDETVESVIGSLLAAETDDDCFFASFGALSGRFALLLLKGPAQRAFHDPVGSRSLYYRADGELCLGSRAELIAHAFGLEQSPPAQTLIGSEEYQSRTVGYLPGDLTLNRGVHGLAPNNYHDLTERRTVRYWPHRAPRPTTFDEFFDALDEYFAALSSHLSEFYSPILGVTGGVDTRTMLAAFSNHGLAVQGVTWLRRGAARRRTRLPWSRRWPSTPASSTRT
jgi:hypothetical protein